MLNTLKSVFSVLTGRSRSTYKTYMFSKCPWLIKAIRKTPARSGNNLPAANRSSTYPSKLFLFCSFFELLHKSDCRNSNRGAKATARSRHCSPKSTLFTRSCDLCNQLEPRLSVSPTPRLLVAVLVKLPVYSFNPGDYNSNNSQSMFCWLMHSHRHHAAWVDHILTTNYE